MMDTSEDNLKTQSLRSALARGGKDMKALFERRSQQLRVSLPPIWNSAVVILSECKPLFPLAFSRWKNCKDLRYRSYLQSATSSLVKKLFWML